MQTPQSIDKLAKAGLLEKVNQQRVTIENLTNTLQDKRLIIDDLNKKLTRQLNDKDIYITDANHQRGLAERYLRILEHVSKPRSKY